MDAILAWLPVLWLSRILAVLVLGGATLVAGLLVGRVLRPTTRRAIFSGELPRLKSLTLGGQRFELLEDKVEAGTALDTQRDEQLRALEKRVETMVSVLRKYGEHLAAHREALDALLDDALEDHDDEDDKVSSQEGDTEAGTTA